MADYTVYDGRSGVTCIVPAPKQQASWFLPLTPFTWQMWSAVLCSILLEMAILTVMHRIEKNWMRYNSYLLSHLHSHPFSYGCETVFRIYMSQGCLDLISSWSRRIFLTICYIGSLILTSIYGGGLASLLTRPRLIKYTIVVNTFE